MILVYSKIISLSTLYSTGGSCIDTASKLPDLVIQELTLLSLVVRPKPHQQSIKSSEPELGVLAQFLQVAIKLLAYKKLLHLLYSLADLNIIRAIMVNSPPLYTNKHVYINTRFIFMALKALGGPARTGSRILALENKK